MQFRLSTLLLLALVLWSSLAVFGTSWGIAIFVAAVVAAIFVQKVDVAALESLPWGKIIIVGVCLLVLFWWLLLPTLYSARVGVPRSRCASALQHIALALLNYDAKYGALPPAYIVDKNGRPMHSWRVLILPFLGRDDLYKRYDFAEPWDGPNNRQLLATRPEVYACPHDEDIQSTWCSQTSYVAVVGQGAAWLGGKSRKLSELSPLTSTILLVETTGADVPWTAPRDLCIDSLKSAHSGPSVVTASSRHGDYNGFFYSQRYPCGGINVIFADGHNRFIPPGGLEPGLLSKCLQIGGFDDATADAVDASTYCPPSVDDHVQINWTNCFALLVWLISVGLLLFRAARNRKPKRAAADSSP
jgi:hypothetical protein